MAIAVLKSKRFLLSSLAIALACLVLAPPAQAKDKWTSVRSKNFLLLSNGSEKDIRRVATRLEQFREAFARLFTAAKLDTPVPATVIIFKSQRSYKPFSLPDASGYFQKGEGVNYITLTTESETDPYSIVFHEYVHLLVNNSLGTVPLWFNEGLAEYYSSFEIQDQRTIQVGASISSHVQTLRHNWLLPLRKLFDVKHGSPEYNDASKRQTFYAQSWAVVHYLVSSNNGQRLPRLNKFVQLIAANVSIDEALKQSFQIEVEALEGEVLRYIKNQNYATHLATLDRKVESEREMKVGSLSEAEAQAYLGDLLLHANRMGEAEARLQQALALDPKQPMALSSLGILRARQGRFTEAQMALQEAVKSNTTNYLTHYYYAYALSREGIDESNFVRSYATDTTDRMRSELAKAIEMNPAYSPSYSLLAFVNMVTETDLDRSQELLKKAIALSPERQDLTLMVAQIHMRQQKFELAKQVLENFYAAKDPKLQSRAESLLATIRGYEERLARAQSEKSDSPEKPGGPRKLDATSKDYQPPTESELLQQRLGALASGQSRIQGSFNRLDCDDNGTAYFLVLANDRLYKVRASNLRAVKLTTYVVVNRTLTCGQRKIPENVVVTFRPTIDSKDTRAKIDGDVIAVDLMPNDFRLKTYR